MAEYKQAYNSDGAEINFKTQAESVYFKDGNSLPKELDDLEDRLSGSSTKISTVQYAASSEFIENNNWDQYINNNAWQDTIPSLDSSKPFLYLKITFTNEDTLITFAGSLGKSGEAGVGIEWVYRATALDSDAIIEGLKKELAASMDDKYQNPGKIPTNWTDSLPEPTVELPIVFGARRIYKNGTWGQWSAPIIVARKFTITDGENTFLKKTEKDTAQKRITFKDGITTYGNVDFNNQDGATNTTQINTKLDVTGDAYFKNLTVSGQAHFSTLILDEIKAAGGTYLFSVANPFTVKKVEKEDKGYKVWWKAESENSLNTWAANDYAICAQWNNVTKGTTTDACNKYYWAKVVEASQETAGYYGEVDGDYCHWIIISDTDKDGDGIPEIGDNIAQLGNSSDTNRQSAIVISSYHWIDAKVECPAFVQYTGINSFSLEGCIRNKIDKGGTTLKGNFSSENNETFVTEGGIKTTVTNIINSDSSGIAFYTKDQITDAGLTITPKEGITLDANKTTITGDLNIKGLITDSISYIDESAQQSYKDALIPIDMKTTKSIEVSPGSDYTPIVLLPMYNDQTIVNKTSTDSGLTIPGYTQSGTHLIIRNPFNPKYSLWDTVDDTYWAYKEDANGNPTGDRVNIMRQVVVICADPRILNQSNYYYENNEEKATISPFTLTDYAGGVYFNGRRGRFICLLPGQQIELTSTVKTENNTSYLSWYVSGENLSGLTVNMSFTPNDNNQKELVASYVTFPSGSIWGVDTGTNYQDTIFGYSKLAPESTLTWPVYWDESTGYPYLTVF